MDPDIAVPGASFQQQHRMLAVGRKAIGEHAAGGARADDHIIEFGSIGGRFFFLCHTEDDYRIGLKLQASALSTVCVQCNGHCLYILSGESMPMPTHVLPTTVVGSYPQPDWLVDRAMLSKSVPRTRMHEMWRLPAEHLEQAQDDATIVAIRDMERARIDIVTDGEIRRESYSNRFATALDGVDADNPAIITSRTGIRTPVPRVIGKIRRTAPVELRDMQFLRENTDHAAKITLPGPFTRSQQARNEFYKDDEELAMAFAEAVNAEALDLQKAGADVI